MGKVLFEDDWCKITPDHLSIKCYYFPIGKRKKIDSTMIRGVYYVVQDLSDQWYKVKGWGMAITPCWWACDTLRCCHGSSNTYYNVVIDCGEATYKGFTVMNIGEFLRQLKLVAPHALYLNELPF
ncbi:unnamed protein product [Cylicostephanus goldi]|uniref:Uncharacterized protein n=1 Tax=Cylicostephanus goldi TaxID=71465 RepID=A0A3P7Q7Z2_CYLGO|nr:unnamed protein product [Cylicostephanus goldi]